MEVLIYSIVVNGKKSKSESYFWRLTLLNCYKADLLQSFSIAKGMAQDNIMSNLDVCDNFLTDLITNVLVALNTFLTVSQSNFFWNVNWIVLHSTLWPYSFFSLPPVWREYSLKLITSAYIIPSPRFCTSCFH